MGLLLSKFTPMVRRWFVDRSLWLTSVLVVLAAGGAYLGGKIELKLSLADLLPSDYPPVVKLDELTKIVGGIGFLAIILHADDGQSHIDAAPKIATGLKDSSLVRSVDYHREQEFFMNRMLYYIDLPQLNALQDGIKRQIKQAKRSAFDIGLWDDDEPTTEAPAALLDEDFKKTAQNFAKTSQYLQSQDGKDLLVMIKPSFDSMELEKSRQLVEATETVLKDVLPSNVTYAFGERYYNKILETEMIQGDIVFLGTLAMVLIALCIFGYLRSVRSVLIVLLPVFMGLGIMTGLTYLVLGHINIVTGFLMGIISGLGVDYGIHLLLRLRLEKRDPSSDDPDPVWRTLASSGHSIFTGALAASCSFYLLCFSNFRAFSEFGFICGTGIAAVFICLVGSFATLVRLFKEDKTPPPPTTTGRFQFPVLSLPRGFAVGCALTLGLIALSGQTAFEYDFEKLMRHSKEIEARSHLIDTIYGRSSAPAAIWTATKQEGLDVEQHLKANYIPSVVSEMISSASIIPEQQQEKERILNQIRKDIVGIKDSWLEESLDVPASSVHKWIAAKPFTFDDIPQNVRDILRGTTKSGYLMYVYPAVKLHDAQGIHTYADMFRSLEKQFPKILTGSDSILFSDILKLVKHDGLIILVVIFFAVGLFIRVNTHSWRDMLLSYIPLILSLPVGMGLMAIFGIKFDIFNISIIPSFVGLGIDVPIHLLHRAKETRSGYKAARDLSLSIFLALLTSAVGFGVLIFARAGVLRSLGWVAVLGILAIYWVGMFLLPAYHELSMRKITQDSDTSDKPKCITA